ncbi:DUF4856 domain-containing protein [Haliangium sp.]|uniref:DUF4856 domain-containing protein n=1 Tax=Haliangium sp. TaxID=2663208 RepID=UPI003D0B146B
MHTSCPALLSTAVLAVLAVLAGCGDNIGFAPDATAPPAAVDARPPDARTEVVVPMVYGFESRFRAGVTGVAYGDEVLIHILLGELDRTLTGLTQAIDDGDVTPTAGETTALLDRFYDFDVERHGRTPLLLTTDPPLRQPTLDSVASFSDLNLRQAIAGNDLTGAHRDWTNALAGWDQDSVASPDDLVRVWFAAIDAQAADRAAGTIPTGPDGAPIPAVTVTPQGQDLQVLLRTFLLGAITFARATDLHLDDADDGLGLAASNAQLGEQLYSAAEHHWDRAFGLFGAAYEYGRYTDEERAGIGGREEWANGYHDTDISDGLIDVRYELNFGTSVLAAERDLDPGANLDYTEALFTAFLTGRALLQASGPTLSEERRGNLVTQRDIIVSAWERVLVDSARRALTDTLADMDAFGSASYDFAAHARHWSALKGHALSLQFSPFLTLSEADVATLHGHLGTAPVLPDALPDDISAYRTALEQARALLDTAYPNPAAAR